MTADVTKVNESKGFMGDGFQMRFLYYNVNDLEHDENFYTYTVTDSSRVQVPMRWIF
jgi:hypothetical protein